MKDIELIPSKLNSNKTSTSEKNKGFFNKLIYSEKKKINESNTELKDDDKERLSTTSTSLSKSEVSEKQDQKPYYFRWAILLSFCIIQIVTFFCYDNAQALQTQFQKGPLNLTTIQFNMLYSIYSCIFFFPFIAGYLSDHYSTRWLMMINLGIQMTGQSLFTLGTYLNNFPLLLFGRFCFEFASYSIDIYECHLISIWFHEREVYLAFGVLLSCARIGSSLTSLITPRLFEMRSELYFPLLIGSLLCMFSFVTGFFAVSIDGRYRKKLEKKLEVQNHGSSFSGMVSDIKSFSSIFWLIVFSGTISYSIFEIFENNSNDFFGTLFSVNSIFAGNVLAGVYLYAAIFTPIFGMLVDKFGNRLNFQFISTFLTSLPLILLGLLPEETNIFIIILILVFLMSCFSINGVIFWGNLSYVVNENEIGTAYGTAYTLLNVFLLIFSIILAGIKDSTKEFRGGYLWFLLTMVMVYLLVIILLTIIYSLNYRKGDFLNKIKMSSIPDDEGSKNYNYKSIASE